MEEDTAMQDSRLNKRMKVSRDSAAGSAEISGMMYQTYMKSILDGIEGNDTAALEVLTSKISLPRSSPDAILFNNLSIIIKSLTNNISKLDNRQSSSIIYEILRIPNWGADGKFSKHYVRFLSVLISGIPKWYNEVVVRLVKDFNGKNTERHHEFFQYLIRVIPTSVGFLVKSLVRNFPDKYCKKQQVVNYVSNLFRFICYCPESRYQLLTVIVEYCLQLDVELKNELDEESGDSDEEDSEEEEDEDEDDEDEEDEEEEDQEEDQEDEEDEEVFLETNLLSVDQLSDKLDSIMMTIIDQLDGSKQDPIVVFHCLISIFKSHILSTSNTRCIQFLMFYISQKLPELVDGFLVSLIDYIFSLDKSMELRVKCVQYLSSYLARAKHVGKNQLVFVISYLVSWLNKFVGEREAEIYDGGGMDRFRLFYAVFQGLMYIFCFRHELLKLDDNKWECEINKFFAKTILTKFNPLKYCNETVVLMFAKIAHEENITYCFSIIDQNRRDQYRMLANKIQFNGLQEFLDGLAYFPFDPLMLDRTGKVLDDLIIQWSELNEDYESDSNSDDYDDGRDEYARGH